MKTSADIIVAVIVDRFEPRSVVNFGCSLGDWLASLEVLGATEPVVRPQLYQSKMDPLSWSVSQIAKDFGWCLQRGLKTYTVRGGRGETQPAF